MTRLPRQKSESGYFHIITRGVGQQILFEEKADYVLYLHLLRRFSRKTGVRICAFCLMENHTHLLVCDRDDHLSVFMKKLGVTYSRYFNLKYGRHGHLFQDRFSSVPIESEESLLIVFRYILNNPREAGICQASEYPWSSYSRYGNPHSFVDTVILQELLGDFSEYAAFIDAQYEDDEQELEKRAHDDEWAKSVIRKTFNVPSGTALKAYDRKTRNEAVKVLREKGLSVRQIERLTGISKSVIQRL